MAGQKDAIRPVWDGFGPLSIEILYSTVLGRPAKAALRLRLSNLLWAVTGRFALCYMPQPLHEKLLTTDLYSSISCLRFKASQARVPLLAGQNRENSGFREVAGCARPEADRIDFLSRPTSDLAMMCRNASCARP